MKYLFISISICFNFYVCKAQIQDTIVTNSQYIENILEGNTNENAAEQLENLQLLSEQKIKLNTATKEELISLRFLNIFQIYNLINYRNQNGEFLDIDELYAIKGFDKKTIKLVHRFTTLQNINKKISFQDFSNYGRQRFLLRNQNILETQKGYTNGKYLGNNYKTLFKYRYSFQDILNINFTGEKDAGEPFSSEQYLGFDFNSFHIAIKDLLWFKKIIIGDYTLENGQGLLSNNFALRKSANTVNIIQFSRGITPYSSTNENLFFRGLALFQQWKYFNFTLFSSKKDIDANLDSKSKISSLPSVGLHRTQLELNKRHNITKYDIGGKIGFTSTNFSGGITVLSTIFNEKFAPQVGKESNLIVSSFDYQYFWNQLHFSGETAITHKGWNTINNLLFDTNENLTLAFSYRNQSLNYFSYYQNSFSESSKAEKGYYFGVKINLFNDVTLHFYCDVYQINKLETYKSEIKKQQDFLFQLNFISFENFTNYIRIKYEENYQIRYNSKYLLNENFNMQWRIELHKKANELGSLIFQDMTYSPSENFSISNRLAFFDTSWNTKIYAYEKDLLYNFFIPAYYDKGIKYFLVFKYKPTSKINFWLKIGQTKYINKQKISSGENKIQGNTKTDLKLQVQIKF